jgi:hypothetical protein
MGRYVCERLLNLIVFVIFPAVLFLAAALALIYQRSLE